MGERISISMAESLPRSFRYLSFTCFTNFPVFLTRMWLCWAKRSRLVRYLVFQLRSLPSLQFFPSCRVGWLDSYIPFETSCVCTLRFDTDTVASLCCFFHIMTLLSFHNTDTLLLLPPFLYAPSFPLLLYFTTPLCLLQLLCDITDFLSLHERYGYYSNSKLAPGAEDI